MSGIRLRISQSVAIVAFVAALAVAGCAGTSGQSPAVPSGSVIAADQPDPVRGSCGDALAMNPREGRFADAGIACIAPQLASGSPWPVSIRAAAKALRDFTGETSLQFEVSGPVDQNGRRIYTLNSSGVNAGGKFVSGSVDADTGRVVGISYTARVMGDAGPRLIEQDAALAKATAFTTLHAIDLTGLVSTAAPSDSGWEFTWEKKVGTVGVPPRVTVDVDWQTGAVVSYWETRVDLGSPPAPAVTQAQAEAAALADQPGFKVEGSFLRFEPNWSGPILVWEVYVSGESNPGATSYFPVRIDAMTGQKG